MVKNISKKTHRFKSNINIDIANEWRNFIHEWSKGKRSDLDQLIVRPDADPNLMTRWGVSNVIEKKNSIVGVIVVSQHGFVQS